MAKRVMQRSLSASITAVETANTDVLRTLYEQAKAEVPGAQIVTITVRVLYDDDIARHPEWDACKK